MGRLDLDSMTQVRHVLLKCRSDQSIAVICSLPGTYAIDPMAATVLSARKRRLAILKMPARTHVPALNVPAQPDGGGGWSRHQSIRGGFRVW
jgi:hypothetical protein